jgi:pimeloyl-ACP methyl ester carboxylesterase
MTATPELHTHTLRDGRTVTYSTCGDTQRDAHPVLFLHPVQGNAYMALVLHAAAQRLGLRVIAPNRPGVCGSSPHPNRRVAQYPADVAELCQHLGASTGVCCA